MSRIHDSLRRTGETESWSLDMEGSSLAAKYTDMSSNPEYLSRGTKGGRVLRRPRPESTLPDSESDRIVIHSPLGDAEELVEFDKEKLIEVRFQDAGVAPASQGTDDSLPRSERSKLSVLEYAREQVTDLVARVFLFPNSSAPQVVVFSGVDRNSDASGMCFHTGHVLSTRYGGEVCVVDAGAGTNSLQQRLRTADVCRPPEELSPSEPSDNPSVPIDKGHVWLLAAGPPEGGKFDRSFTDRMRLLISELRREFDYVLIDAPPLTSAAQSVLLAQMADGLIIIVEANSTRRETAVKAKEMLESAHVKVLGSILNNGRFPFSESVYKKR